MTSAVRSTWIIAVLALVAITSPASAQEPGVDTIRRSISRLSGRLDSLEAGACPEGELEIPMAVATGNPALAALIGMTSVGAPVKKLRVVATTPDLAALTREIGGDAVDVMALAKSTEDPHFVDAKPSYLVALNRADVLIEGGAELELGWLPPLLDNSRNTKIAAGAPGRIVASQGIRLLEIPVTFDRSRGDVHAGQSPFPHGSGECEDGRGQYR